MVFNHPLHLFFFLPLIFVAFLIRRRRGKNYFTHPLLPYLSQQLSPASRLVYLPRIFESGALAALVLALLEPVLPVAEHSAIREGLDVLLVLDLSSSMQEPMDLKKALEKQRLGIREREKTRLDTVKEAMIHFARQRKQDRVGLVVFSENGYVVSPLTSDTPYLIQYLEMIDGKTLSSEGQTGIGEGISAATHLTLKQSEGKGAQEGRVMIVLTDGENNTGRDVYQAILEARAAGFRIHFIGVDVDKAPDAPRLMAAVQQTGGKYYDARDGLQLSQAYSDINRLEKGHFTVKSRMRDVPRFYPFVWVSVALLAGSLIFKCVPYFMEVS